MARNAYYIEMDGTKHAWYADDAQYPSGLLTKINAKKASATESGLVFGANIPRKPKIRLNLENKKSYTVFCNTDKLDNVIGKNDLKGLSYRGSKVRTAGIAGNSR